MGNEGKIAKKKRQNVRFSSYFHSEFHFREETFTVNRETPFTSVFEVIELGISQPTYQSHGDCYFCGLSG